MDSKRDTEILFYHLEQSPLHQVLPVLLQKTLEKGWNAVVQVGSAGADSSEEALKMLDRALWTFSPESFLPHCIYDPQSAENASTGGADDDLEQMDFSRQPVLLCAGDENPNRAQIRFYVLGSEPQVGPPGENPAAGEYYRRLVLMFDGHDPDAVEKARKVWKRFSKTRSVTYWKQDANGTWMKKA